MILANAMVYGFGKVNAKRITRRGVLIGGGAMIAVVLLAAPMFFGTPAKPHVTAVFAGFSDSLRPDRADFAITNHSSVMVSLLGYRKMADGNLSPCQATEIAAGRAAAVSLDFAKPIEFNTQVELQFRRPDTAAEEVREMVDSVLHSMGIKWPGLNPDSRANLFSVTSSVPARVGGR
ncbi:MAG TPA: hypothetical protein VF773_18445 [Verrucomicrobiae bacterium]